MPMEGAKLFPDLFFFLVGPLSGCVTAPGAGDEQ
jgi:hypothetical protein